MTYKGRRIFCVSPAYILGFCSKLLIIMVPETKNRTRMPMKAAGFESKPWNIAASCMSTHGFA